LIALRAGDSTGAPKASVALGETDQDVFNILGGARESLEEQVMAINSQTNSQRGPYQIKARLNFQR
jgi:hypothetical protein